VAAFFEGFVTRYYKMHWIFSSLILFLQRHLLSGILSFTLFASKEISDSNKWRSIKRWTYSWKYLHHPHKKVILPFLQYIFLLRQWPCPTRPGPDTVVIQHMMTLRETEQSGTGYEPSDYLIITGTEPRWILSGYAGFRIAWSTPWKGWRFLVCRQSFNKKKGKVSRM